MRYVLSRHCLPVLKCLAREPTLCAFDFDGTLAPIVGHPDLAVMRDCTRRLLASLASLYPSIVISGRARADLLTKLDGVKVDRAFGNHGAEGEETVAGARQTVRGWKAALEPTIRELPGVWVEDKGVSLSVHYRQSPRKAEALRRILEASRTLESSRVIRGKQVVNLVKSGAPGKREALASERDRLGCARVLFIGDDDNDEDAFALDGNTVAVRVGRKQRSHAGYYLRSQAEIDTVLHLLVSLRTTPGKTS
jgi:trehalose 6-phosphate phosphatase